MGKDLTGVRSPHRKLMPDKVGSDIDVPTSLRAITIKAKVKGRHRFQDLYRCLDFAFLAACWKDLNRPAASGVDAVTAAAYEENLDGNIQSLVEQLKAKRTVPGWYAGLGLARKTVSRGHWAFRPLKTSWCRWYAPSCLQRSLCSGAVVWESGEGALCGRCAANTVCG